MEIGDEIMPLEQNDPPHTAREHAEELIPGIGQSKLGDQEIEPNPDDDKSETSSPMPGSKGHKIAKNNFARDDFDTYFQKLVTSMKYKRHKSAMRSSRTQKQLKSSRSTLKSKPTGHNFKPFENTLGDSKLHSQLLHHSQTDRNLFNQSGQLFNGNHTILLGS